MVAMIKSKIQMKDLGSPKKAAMAWVGDDKSTVTSVLLGTIIGIASREVSRTNPQGEAYHGIGGTFEAIPADPNGQTVRAGIIYFPPSLHEMIVGELNKASGPDKNADVSLRFGFQVYVVKDSNPQGYTWQFSPVMDAAPDDPLESLRQSLPQLTDQREAQTETPAKAKGKKAAA